MDSEFELLEVLRRAAKYLIEGMAVAFAAFYVPQSGKLNLAEVGTIALTAAATFAILELYSPAIGASARAGAGLSIGSSLMGGIATRAV